MLLATEQRLLAERDQQEAIDFKVLKDIDGVDQNKRAKMIANQISFFDSRVGSLKNQVDIIDKKIDQAENEVIALNAQLDSASEQLALIQEDLEEKRSLFENKIIDKGRVKALEREKANWSGNYTKQD